MDTNDMIISKGNIKAVASALASQTRLDIINMLSKKNMKQLELIRRSFKMLILLTLDFKC